MDFIQTFGNSVSLQDQWNDFVRQNYNGIIDSCKNPKVKSILQKAASHNSEYNMSFCCP